MSAPIVSLKMFLDKTVLAVILARGGSKRLPNKNIKPLQNKPLIAWSIEAGKASQYIDEVVVSTDTQEIAEVAKAYGASVPFMRPAELSEDTSSSFDALEHTILSMDKKYDYVMLLQPTSPLRSAVHIDEAIELLFEKKADSIISVCEVDHSPRWSNILLKDQSMENFIAPEDAKHSQALPTYYRLNGAIYLLDREIALKKRTLFIGENSYAYVMDRTSSIDIDTELDFKIAECITGTLYA
jgi:CMP-N,N'-diacetyllegionaminic acid synthase